MKKPMMMMVRRLWTRSFVVVVFLLSFVVTFVLVQLDVVESFTILPTTTTTTLKAGRRGAAPAAAAASRRTTTISINSSTRIITTERVRKGLAAEASARSDDTEEEIVENTNEQRNHINRRRRDVLMSAVAGIVGSSTIFFSLPQYASGRLEPVNRPDLLPTENGMNVIQIEKFLTSGQAKKMNNQLIKLEQDTGFRVRVLCQAYPKTPGLAIRDYWNLGKDDQIDDKYVVLVVDQFGGKGNVLNFNVGEGVKLALPNVFWTRLQSKYGTTFYVRDNGIDLAIENAIEAIISCLRSEEQYCVNVPDGAPSFQSLLG